MEFEVGKIYKLNNGQVFKARPVPGDHILLTDLNRSRIWDSFGQVAGYQVGYLILSDQPDIVYHWGYEFGPDGPDNSMVTKPYPMEICPELRPADFTLCQRLRVSTIKLRDLFNWHSNRPEPKPGDKVDMYDKRTNRIVRV